MSLGRSPEQSLVIWDIATGDIVAVGRVEGSMQAVAWIATSAQPEFVTVGDQVLLWTLESSHLRQKEISLPSESNSHFTCACSDNLGRIFIGDDSGCIWTVSCRAVSLSLLQNSCQTSC